MHYPTLQSRNWLLFGNIGALWPLLLYGGPPLLPVVVLDTSGPFSSGTPGWLPFAVWAPSGLIAGWVLLFACLNLIAAAVIGRRAGFVERLTVDFLDRQLQALVRLCMFRVEVIRTESQADSRLLAFFAAIVFLPGVLALGAATLAGLIVPLVLTLAWTLLVGTIPGWWLAYAPRLIQFVDVAAYTVMTGRSPDYRLEFAPLEYDSEAASRPPPDGTAIDRPLPALASATAAAQRMTGPARSESKIRPPSTRWWTP